MLAIWSPLDHKLIKNADRIKTKQVESYDPSDRKEKYEKEKRYKEDLEKRIFPYNHLFLPPELDEEVAESCEL